MHERTGQMRTKTRGGLDALRRRNARKAADVRRGMPPARPTLPDDGSVRAVVEYGAHRIVRAEDAAREFAGERHAEDEQGTIVVLSGCVLRGDDGIAFERDAVVHLGGHLAHDLSIRSQCLQKKAFLLHGAVAKRSDRPRSYDLVAFSGTSPRPVAQAG